MVYPLWSFLDVLDHFRIADCNYLLVFFYLLQAKLAFVPILPEAVLGLAFVTVIAISVALQKDALVVTDWI